MHIKGGEQGRSQDFKGGVSSVGVPAYAYICACALHKHSAHNTVFSRGAKLSRFSRIRRLKTAKIAASAISVAPRLPMRAGAAKIKTAKISSDALRGDSAKFCIREIFPLYASGATSWKHDLRHGALKRVMAHHATQVANGTHNIT